MPATAKKAPARRPAAAPAAPKKAARKAAAAAPAPKRAAQPALRQKASVAPKAAGKTGAETTAKTARKAASPAPSSAAAPKRATPRKASAGASSPTSAPRSSPARPSPSRSAPAAATPARAAPQPAAAAMGMGAAAVPAGVSEVDWTSSWLPSLGKLTIPAQAWQQAQATYLEQASALWNATLAASAPGAHGEAAPIQDRRFAHEAWRDNPATAFVARMYLLNAQTLLGLAQAAQGDAKARARLRFSVQQMVDALAPSNFLALNPEAQALAVKTQGESLMRGAHLLLGDLQRGHVSQTDESAFEVGRNVATTEGDVVFENDFFQLIEYKPLTAQVHERPFLLVPPSINKYYILDLQPENSFVRHAVAQGHRTFLVSWRNPDASCAHWTWEDVIEGVPLEAIRVVQEICGVEQMNMLGFCIGGTILATALAVLEKRGQRPAASFTLLTSLLDFEDNGVLDVFIDEPTVRLREMTIGSEAPNGPGLLKGSDLATTFSFLRPNDLVWNYVVGNYLKGEPPPAFDLLYWNGDSTNMSGPLYCWYLRHTYLQNDLKAPNQLTVCGEPLELGAIRCPIYVYASREDHIVPWQAAYRSTQLFAGPTRFMLGASGHIAGVINPPADHKRSHWIGQEGHLPADPAEWLAAAREEKGSWWGDWTAWLASHAGRLQPAPRRPGGAGHAAIEPAPGRYVKVKASA